MRFAHVERRARPPPLHRAMHQSSPDRVQFDIAERLPLVRIVERARVETILPHVSSLSAPQVEPARIVIVSPAQCARQPIPRFRNGQDVDVIVHEAVPGNADTLP